MRKATHYEQEFLDHVQDMVDYWDKQPDISCKEKIQGAFFSLLATIDTGSVSLGPYCLKPMMPDETEGPNIAGELHVLLYEADREKNQKINIPLVIPKRKEK